MPVESRGGKVGLSTGLLQVAEAGKQQQLQGAKIQGCAAAAMATALLPEPGIRAELPIRAQLAPSPTWAVGRG